MTTAPQARVSLAGPLDKHHFLLRRLHSLSGIVPVGVFVMAHMFTNAQMIWGETNGHSEFQHEVGFIHSLPFLFFIETSLWGAIAFHAVLGIWYTLTGKTNVASYTYGDNIRYTLQRVTGIIALVFIFLHVATLRWRWDVLWIWDTPFYGVGHQVPDMPHSLADAPLSLPLTAYALQYSALIALFYLVGVMAVVFHWSNGLWTAAITWGLTISTQSMRRWGFVCIGVFVALTVFFVAAFIGALRYDFDQMRPDQKAAMIFTVGGENGMFDKTKKLKADLESIGMESVLIGPVTDAPAKGPIIEPSDTPNH